MPSWKKVIISGSAAELSSLYAPSITGSLQGTASWAINAVTASYATNAADIVIYVKNTTGTQIDKGKVVRITGATGDNALISTASYESDPVSANTLGITRENIANDAFGYVITEGTLLGINTNLWTAGQLLFLGASGSITGSAPLAPLHAVRLGQVLRVQQNNGSMYVRIDNGYELNELHDVDDTTTTGSYGDLLVKSGSVWTNSRQLTGSYGLTGSLSATSFTGSLQGTASFAVTASYFNAAVVTTGSGIESSLYSTSPMAGNSGTRLPLSSSITFGYQAGYNSSASKYVNLLGYRAGYSTNDVSYSNFIGHSAGSGADNADQSAFIGYRAGYLATGANNSVFIGYIAGQNQYSASYSTIIGSSAGRSGSWGALGNNNIIIGTNISLPNGYANYVNFGGVLFISGTYGTTSGDNLTTPITNGRIGIGIVNPSASLHIANTSTFNSFLVEDSTNPDNTPFLIDNAGNVMIGTTSSKGTVTIATNGADGLVLDTDTASNTQSSRLFFKNSGSFTDFSIRNAAQLLIIAAAASASVSTGTGRLYISASGDVSIGPGYSPSSTRNAILQLSGSVNIEEGFAYKQDGNDILYITRGATGTSYDNIIGGVGAVSGAINPDQTTAYGYYALAQSNGTAFTAVGYAAGRYNSGSSQTLIGWGAGLVATGSNQTAVGYSAGYLNSGTNQTAVGYNAGYLNTVTQQTAIGLNAGIYNIGVAQTALGQQAGQSNTGSAQTAVGYAAGFQNSGSVQVAIGSQAGRDNKGSFQTATGYEAGRLNIADYQSAHGYRAGYANTGSNQTAIGSLAGRNNSGSNQTAVGVSAGEENIGNTQTAIGSYAGYANSGSAQTATGYEAGRLNTADFQTAVGYSAGYANTGSAQTATGYQAGTYNSGSNQTATGFQAGVRNQGTNQTVTGYQAGYENTGSNQSAFGYQAGFENSGSNQVAMGNSAGESNSGNNQTAIGSQAGYLNTGSNQTAVGYAAGFRNSGSNNTNIGYQAGTYTTGVIINSQSAQSVFLGSSTTAGGGNRTNQIVIGYNAEGIGSNSVVLGNSSITTTALRGDVGIGTTTPTAKLDIVYASSAGTGVLIRGGGGVLDSTPLKLWDIGTAINNRNIIEFAHNSTYVTASRIYSINPSLNATTGGKLVLETTSDNIGTFNTSQLVLSNNGNVGIGTDTPTYTLQIQAAPTASIRLQETGSGGNKRLDLTIDAFGVARISANQSAQQMAFDTVGSERIRITSTGNVGIGTTTPLASLHATGSAIISGSMVIGSSSLGPFENTLTLGARDNASEGGQIGFNAPGGTYTSASFIDNWQNKARILKGNNTTSTGLIAQWDIHTTQMQLPGYNNSSAFIGTAAGYLAFDSSGNILTVGGVTATPGGSNTQVQYNNGGTLAGTPIMTITNPTVQISGSTSITGSLTVTQPIYVPINGGMYFQGGDDAALYDINVSNHMGIYGVQDSTVATIKLGSGGGTISGQNNRIGIATTTPNATLDVNGDTIITGSFTVTGSYNSPSGNTIDSNALIQAGLLYLSNNF